MSVGGTNPVCSRLPGLSGCGTNVDSVGVDVASRILFSVLTDWSTSSTGWNNFAALAMVAAFDLYSNCPSDDATAEQTSALEAFTAIGYPPAYPVYWECY
jgi:hypothetical protein